MLPAEVWEGWRYQIVMSVGLPGERFWSAVRPLEGWRFAIWVDGVGEEAAKAASEYATGWAKGGMPLRAPEKNWVPGWSWAV